MAKKIKPFKLDSYRSRAGRVAFINQPDNMYAKPVFANMAVILFVIIDLFCLKIIWNLVQSENPVFVWSIAAACAMALDIPLAIAAIAVKKYHHGLCDKKEKNIILVLSVSVFVIAFLFSFGFRIMTKDLSFEIEAGSNMENTMETSTEEIVEENPAVLYAALFNGVIPLLTSLSSYVISYFSYNPVDGKLVRLKRERIGLQNNILEAEKALTEAETAQQHSEGLIARENDLYAEFIRKLDADAHTMEQLVRVLIAEKLGTPEGVTAMTNSGERVAEKYEKNDEHAKELVEHIRKQFENETKVIALKNNQIVA